MAPASRGVGLTSPAALDLHFFSLLAVIGVVVAAFTLRKL